MSARRDIVLVVDDSPATLGVLNEALEAAGYTVLVAQGGSAALSLVARVTPDIVLMDALMPGLDGFATCRALKALPALSGVPVVFMTGLTDTAHVIQGLEAGGVDYVTKPVAPDEVIARIGVHLANARLTRSAQLALDTAGRFLLAVDRAGRLLWATPQAARLIDEAGVPGAGVSGAGVSEAGVSGASALPAEVLAWVAECVAAAGDAGRAPLTVAARTGGPALQLSYVGQVGPDELLLRLVAAPVTADAAAGDVLRLRAAHALTAREAEVLLWLSRGKSNRDIGEILGLSPRTVSKHLEQVFAKLGVENRASATALAVKVLQTGAG